MDDDLCGRYHIVNGFLRHAGESSQDRYPEMRKAMAGIKDRDGYGEIARAAIFHIGAKFLFRLPPLTEPFSTLR